MSSTVFSKSSSFNILGPSLGALSGSGCTSKKKLVTPKAEAARVRPATLSRLPPDAFTAPFADTGVAADFTSGGILAMYLAASLERNYFGFGGDKLFNSATHFSGPTVISNLIGIHIGWLSCLPEHAGWKEQH